MIVVGTDEFKINEIEYLDKIKNGAIFIYPTDTIYGIGCNALDDKAVAKLREIKGRHTAPYSIIVPGTNWIKENCHIDAKAEEWIEKLPGALTLILNLKNKKAISQEVTKGLDTVGVRIPDHWISKTVEKLGVPIITTSVNKSGNAFMTSMDDIDHDIRAKVHFIIEQGKIKGNPSKLVHLHKQDTEVVER